MGRIPDRWEEYQSVGKQIVGTRFISFKVPLHQGLCRCLPPEHWFTPQMLVEHLSHQGLELGLVIDLTNTTRYYPKGQITDAGIEYVKIFTEGHVVPSANVQKQFTDAVNNFLDANKDNGRLIGVHCTHGLNRTGYLVCRYMIDKMNFEPDAAIGAFNVARGYKIERQNYLNDLRGIADSCLQSKEEKEEEEKVSTPANGRKPTTETSTQPERQQPADRASHESSSTNRARQSYDSRQHLPAMTSSSYGRGYNRGYNGEYGSRYRDSWHHYGASSREGCPYNYDDGPRCYQRRGGYNDWNNHSEYQHEHDDYSEYNWPSSGGRRTDQQPNHSVFSRLGKRQNDTNWHEDGKRVRK